VAAIQATAYQMTVLLQYNDGDCFTVAELQQNTNMDKVSISFFTLCIFVAW